MVHKYQNLEQMKSDCLGWIVLDVTGDKISVDVEDFIMAEYQTIFQHTSAL